MIGVILLVAAGAAGVLAWQKFEASRRPPPNVMAGVDHLEKGKKYAVELIVAPIGTTDELQIADYLAGYLRSAGFEFLSVPALRSAEDRIKMLRGEPADWVTFAEWKLDQPYVTGSNASVLNARVTPLPLV